MAIAQDSSDPIAQVISVSSPSKLQFLEIKQRKDQTVLALSLKSSVDAKMFTLPNPDRLVVDLPRTQASSTLPKDIHSDGFIKRIRLGNGPSGPGNLRVVVDLSQTMSYVSLFDEDPQTHRQTIQLILTPIKNVTPAPQRPPAKSQTWVPYQEALDLEDLNKQSSSEKPVLKSQSVEPLNTGRANLLPMPDSRENITSINLSKLKKIVVMIDPGHGGKDSGAIGPGKHMEKNIVLAISLKLQKCLNQCPGIDARLTRKGDYFIPLRGRINMARRNHAGLFMAIHADAFNNTASGASVFALSEHGATSEAARWLAQRENTSELSGIDFKTKDRELRSVLLDMSQTSTIQYSLNWGGNILGALKSLTRLHANDVEQAGFMVLKSPDIPSVLIETGFVTNPSEEEKLITPEYQTQLAEAISQGTMRYLANNPPPDSWFEMQYKG